MKGTLATESMYLPVACQLLAQGNDSLATESKYLPKVCWFVSACGMSAAGKRQDEQMLKRSVSAILTGHQGHSNWNQTVEFRSV